jgi:hypothetical protein
VHNALVDFADQDVDLVVISGGDGTVQAVLTVLFHQHPFAKQPQLMVLEAGTTNMIAGDVGVLGNQNQALSRLFQWVQTGSGKVTKIQRPIIRLQIPGHEVKCGMFFGAGAISQGIQYYHKNLHNKGLRGFPGICLTLGRYLWAIICKNSHSTTAVFWPAPLLGGGKGTTAIHCSPFTGQIPTAGPAFIGKGATH